MCLVLPCPIAHPAHGLTGSSEPPSRSGAFRNAWCDCRSGGACVLYLSAVLMVTGILLEHYAGKLPFWLASVQAVVATIASVPSLIDRITNGPVASGLPFTLRSMWNTFISGSRRVLVRYWRCPIR